MGKTASKISLVGEVRVKAREMIKNIMASYIRIYREQNTWKKTDEKNKLWYFDSPYHPATLSVGKNAPYMMVFPIKMVYEMIGILHNDKIDELREIKYFIKSDYNPQYRY